ncbi:MAG: fibronectin type III domain-containing protein [Treponema sp.]|nr:fibronectin type III domain-containing protein [Treponema sp.]
MNNLRAFVPLCEIKGKNIILVILAVLMLSSCAEMFQEKISFGNTGAPGSLDDLFRTDDEITKLLPPEQLFVASYYSSSEIRLTWTPVRGAAYYMLERAVMPQIPELNAWEDPEDGDFEPLDRFVYETSYTDEILRNPVLDSIEYQNKYFYRVSAFNTARKYEESEPTSPQSAMLFRAPTGLRASAGTSVDNVDLRWERAEGAVSYEIWRSDLPNGASATMLGTVPGNQIWFLNRVSAAEQGKDFYYMVIARNSFGNRTLQTRPAYGYARVFGSPDKPANVKLQENSGRGHSRNEIKIQWDAANEPDVYYAVFRYSSVDSSLTRLTEKTESTTWSDTMGLRPGIFYYYRVQAIVDDISSGRALRSEFSSPYPEGFVLSSPETVIAERDGNNIIVKWMPAIGNENERIWYKYNVYSDAGLTGAFANLVEGNVEPLTDAQGYVSAELTGIPYGHTFFRVTTINAAGSESDRSLIVSPAPAAAVIVDASRHAFIENASANSSGVFPVRITWKKPENDTPAFYHVQRSTRSGTGFSRVNEIALNANGPWSDVYFYDAGTGVYTFIDRNDQARVGRKYYYRVLSLNQLEQGNFPSDERTGWGALTYVQYMLEYNRTMKSALRKLTLMHRPGSTDKLGTETRNGSISGTIYYNASLAGLGARIIIRLTNYADFYIENDPVNGVYFTISGESNTSANMSANGSMDGTVTATGMYPGRVFYDRVEIRGGAAAGGTYGIQQDGFPRGEVSWTVGEQ